MPEPIDFPSLTQFKGEQLIFQVSREVTIEVQLILKRCKFLKSNVDGIVGSDTAFAFNKFKEACYLERPNVLGATTAKELLEAAGYGTHITPMESNIRIPQGVAPKPKNLIGLIPGNKIYTWEQATHNYTRIPYSPTIVSNIIKLAIYLEGLTNFIGDIFIPTSWYRPPTINQAVGGATNSFHIHGLAADGYVKRLPSHSLFEKVDLWHGHNGGLGKAKTFMHIDLRGYRARWIYV